MVRALLLSEKKKMMNSKHVEVIFCRTAHFSHGSKGSPKWCVVGGVVSGK